MIRRRTLLTSALTAGAALGLASCGDEPSNRATGSAAPSGASASGAISGVKVSGEFGSEPQVSFSAPLTVTAPESKLVARGTGAAIADGDLLFLRTAYLSAQDGTVLQSAWQGAPANVLAASSTTNGQQTADFLRTATVGSRFAMLGQVKDSQGQPVSVVQVSDIVDKVLPRAAGTARPVPSDQVQYTLGREGAPSLTGKPTMAAPSTTLATVAIEGAGRATAAGDSLAMHYTGWKLSDGSQFDSSWERGEPFTFVLGQGQVIPGWDEPLAGRPVGSQLLLVIPAAEAYGDQGELAGETLVFVADILGAVAPVAA